MAAMRNRWLGPFGRYLALILIGNLAWEIGQLPLYAIWTEGTLGRMAFAVAHCTGGDALIATAALAAGWLLAGMPAWPHQRYGLTAFFAIVVALAYTVFSEWLNVSVRGSWAYAAIMPTVPPFGTGLAPLLQWLVVPAVVFRYARPN
jgi:hypothetical protein